MLPSCFQSKCILIKRRCQYCGGHTLASSLRARIIAPARASKNRNSDASTNFGCGCPEHPGGCPTQHCGCPGTHKSIQIDTYAWAHIVWPRVPFGEISATDAGSSNNRHKRDHSCVVATFVNDLSGKYGLSTYCNKITVITFISAEKAKDRGKMNVLQNCWDTLYTYYWQSQCLIEPACILIRLHTSRVQRSSLGKFFSGQLLIIICKSGIVSCYTFTKIHKCTDTRWPTWPDRNGAILQQDILDMPSRPRGYQTSRQPRRRGQPTGPARRCDHCERPP